MNSSDPSPPPGQYYQPELMPEAGGPAGIDHVRKYWLMVIERKWYALAVFLLTMIATTMFTLRTTPYYSGVVTIQILKHGAQLLRVADVVESSITSDTDYNTQIKVLNSQTIIQNVAAQLTPEELKLLIEPYKASSGENPSPAAIIFKNRQIIPQRMSLVTVVEFQHPNAKIAARVANLIASEYIAYNSHLRVEESMKAVDELRDRADQQRKRVDELATSLQEFRQRGNLISLVQSKDIVTEKLKALNIMTTQTSQRLSEAQVRWSQVQDWTKAGRDLSELPFVTSQPTVGQLLLQLTTQKLNLSQLRERYKEKHPRFIEAANSVTQTELELQTALTAAAASIKSEYENALQNDEGARAALAEQETRSLTLDKSSVEYDNLNRDYRINEELLESMMARMRETTVTSSIETENARIIDRAYESSTPTSPKLLFNLAIGAFAGIFLGMGFALLIATLDDRIKTIFDVETLVGLPLLGIIPQIEHMDLADKAQIVSNGSDRSVVEAFLSVYSNLRINDASRNAKLILVTSTVPGEGKSFITTNLGLTFASQGQRTVIVDCDLRKPNIERSFRLNTKKGVASYCGEGAKVGFTALDARLDEVVVKNVHPNLDIVTVGGRVKNPINLLNSTEFEQLVAELGKRYDRVLFDTPPLGAVSDALNIVHLMDGIIYAIKFSGVKRGMAQRCAKRLKSANIPIFGAVMNGMNPGIVGDYYMESDSKAFKKYYEPVVGMESKSIAS